MNAPVRPTIALAGLVAVFLSLGAVRESRALVRSRDYKPFSLIETLLGESRALFANHFFVKADAYFHSGYYPTIFDQKDGPKTLHIAADAGVSEEHHDDAASGFLGRSLDPFETFSRHFFPAKHTHLDEGGASDHDHDHDHDGHPDHSAEDHDEEGGDVREMLPWLKVATELDPSNVETYAVTAFWLRTKLNRSREAEEVIREGLWNNPRNPTLLMELGRIFFRDRKDYDRSRNVFEAALRSLDKADAGKAEPDTFLRLQILTHLAELETETGHFDRAISRWEESKPLSPFPEAVQQRIDDVRAQMTRPAAAH